MPPSSESTAAQGRTLWKIPATVWALGLVSLFMDISSEMVQTLLPLYLATGLGVSVLAIGFVEGLAVAIATATRFLSGIITDRTGRAKPLAMLGYGLGALSRLVFPLASGLDQIVLGRAMDRVGKGIRSAPRDAMIAAASPPAMQGAAFGLRKSLDTLGGFIGPVIAVLAMLYFAGNIASVLWLAVIPAGIAMAVLVFGVRDATARDTDPGAPARPPFRLSDALRLTPGAWGAIGLAGLLMLARFSEAFVLLKAVEAGVSPVWVPLAMVVMHLAYGLTAYPVGRLSDRIGREGLILVSLVFLMAAHLVLAFAGTVWVFGLGTILWGLHMGFSQGLLGAMVATAAPAHLRGSAFGTLNLVTGLVALCGNTAAGWLWQSHGSHMPFLAGAGLSALTLLLIARRIHRGHGPQHLDPST